MLIINREISIFCYDISTGCLLAQSTEYSPSRSVKVQRTINKTKTEVAIIPYTPEDALIFILNTGISKDMYIQTRLGSETAKCGHLPVIREGKRSKKTMLSRWYNEG